MGIYPVSHSHYVCVVLTLLSTHADRQGVDNYIVYCLFVCLFVIVVILCVCTVTDFSVEDKASGVKFCTVVHWRLGQGISHFGELCSTRNPKSDESASHREVTFSMGRPTANVTL